MKRDAAWLAAPRRPIAGVTRAALLAAIALPVLAQTLAPAPRALGPAAPAPSAHPCLPPPQGHGPGSGECRRECERVPHAQQCPRQGTPSAAPNWNAPAQPLPGAAPAAPSAPGAGPAQAFATSAPTPPRAPSPAPTVDPGPPGGTPVRLPRQPIAAAGANASAPLPPTSIAGASQSEPGRTTAGPPAVIPAPATAPSSAGSPVSDPGPPGGTPIRLPKEPASKALDAVAPAPAGETPRIEAATFVVDFGRVANEQKVRRTVVLNATAAGEAEFMLKAGNAPGFSITEVRVMGEGVVTAPKTPAIALAPGGTPRRPEDSAPRSVASRVTAAPWKVKFSGPAELQVDLLYAPKFSLFDNPAGPKAAQLDARVRNARGDGMGVPFDLRAQFEGLALGVSVAVKTPEVWRRHPAAYSPGQPLDALYPSALTLSLANLSGATLPVRIEGGTLPQGISARTVELTLKKDETRDVQVPLQYVAVAGFQPGDASVIVQAGAQRSEARFQVKRVTERNFQVSGENWTVGVQILPQGPVFITAACWLKFPQTRNECRFVLDAGKGIARSIVMVADTGRTSSCYFTRSRIGDGTAETIPEVVAAMEAPMVVLRSLEEGKSPKAPGVRHERHVLQPVDDVRYHEGCAEYLYEWKAPAYGWYPR